MVKKRIKNEKVTISDVAKLSGVVPSTVSHVINGTAHISDETKERVLRAIEELNYSPNALARALRQKRTRLIGVVLQDISSEFYARCAASMLEEARKNNYIVLLCDASFKKENVKVGVSALIERRVDGLVFVGGGDDEDILQEAVSANVPVVLGDRDSAEYPSVVFNNEETVRKLVCALYDSGYRKFVYAGEPLLIQNNLMARYNGYLEGIKMCGIPEEDHYEVLDEELHQIKLSGSYYHFMKLLKEKGTEKKQVVITSNDMIAHGLIAAALKLGIRIPEDLAVVGFDDIIISEFFQPPLTTIRQDAELLGKSCYELLKNVIHGKKNNEQIVLTQKVIVRESACIPEDILARYQ